MADPVTPDREQPLLLWTLGFLRPYWKQAVLLSVLLLSEVGLGALQPWPLKVVIDYVLERPALPLPEPFAGWLSAIHGGNPAVLLILLVIAGVIVQVANQFVSAYGTQVQVDTGQRMVYDLRYRLFQHLQALGLHHHIATSTGDAVYRVDVDAYAIENLVMSGLFPLATSVTTLAVMFFVLLKLDRTVALLSLTVVPFLYMCLRYYTSTMVDREEHVKELESKLIERLYETFSSMRLVKSFAREPYELDRYSQSGDRTMSARIALTWQQSLFSVVVTSITILGTALVIVVGGMHVMRGQMTIGDMTIVIAYLGAVYGPLSAIAHTTGQLQGALAGSKRVRSVFAILPETVDGPDSVDATDVKGDIRFEDVGFTYPSGAQVLHDIAFSATPGQVVALVGLTGAGKTTLVSLIPRFFDATAGRVLIDGVDVKQYRVRSLREKIAIVLQDPVLFSGTIAENLRYGRLDATPAEIEAAARAAHAHEFISRLPKAYETEIAEAGGGLSGGERQRLSVARAILKNAPILILDEPTSSLDAISEEIVFAALRRLRAGRTTIVIAHRLSTVRDADRILVLDGGKIAAQGRHEELLKTSQLYRRMCARLSVGKSLDEPETVDELIQATRQ
ncbi:MAG: ABC transporter ATP-binding protein [Acidobacteria bacterium]|nr:ABC transporter ATP-binding protein [Acidobacteriota bacterium]